MTSIEWLFSEMMSKGFFKETITLNKILNLEYKAEKMHKQEMKECWKDGFRFDSKYKNFEEYYKETFNK